MTVSVGHVESTAPSEAPLLYGAQGSGFLGCSLRLGENREEDGSENCDDGNNNEELDKGETLFHLKPNRDPRSGS